MSATSNRPYAGTWKEGGYPTVDVAPDTVVRINGGWSLLSCARCGSRIDVNRYVIETTVEAGTEPGGTSATFTLSLPATLAWYQASRVIPVGAEVEVFMRGYFPATGLFPDLDPPERTVAAAQASALTPAPDAPSTVEVEDKTKKSKLGSRPRNQAITQVVVHESDTRSSAETEAALGHRHLSAHYTVDADGSVARLVPESRVASHAGAHNARSVGIEVSNPDYGRDARPGQQVIRAPWMDKGSYAVPPREQTESTWRLTQDIARRNNVPVSFPAERGDSFRMTSISSDQANQPGIISHAQLSGNKADGSFEVLYGAIRSRGYDPDEAYDRAVQAAQQGSTVTLPPKRPPDNPPSPARVEPPRDDVTLSREGGRAGTEDLAAYPYYPVFRGVVTNIGEGRSEGAVTLSVQCASLLHFWQYQVVSSNASVFGVRPSGSGLKTSDLGHNLVGRHPYQILYELHYDEVGAAAGVEWALTQKTNRDARTDGGQTYKFLRDYWTARFSSKEVKLRMHAATGQLLTALQSAFLARTPTDDLLRAQREKNPSPLLRGNKGTGILDQAYTLNLLRPDSDTLRTSSKGAPLEFNLAEMQAFVSNLGEWGQFQYFESAYETKMDVAQKVCEVTGFEFFQDVDGDFVFKPKMYNMDTSPLRAYRIEPHEILSWNADEKEPPVTYARVRGSRFENLSGTGTEGVWGIEGQYVDYRLVAQFGWRPLEIESASVTNPTTAFYLAASKVDESNALTSTATVTIPLRPELRPGYPVYVRSRDCFYYVTGITHSYSQGGNAQTTLQMVARREPFRPPGVVGGEARGIQAVTLGNPSNPPRSVVARTDDGALREVGFPNVILALDPTRLDPVYLRAGVGFDNIDNPAVLRALLETAADQRIIRRLGNGTYEADIPDDRGGSRPVRLAAGSGAGPGGVDVLKSASVIARSRKATQKERAKLEAKLREAESAGSDPTGGKAAQKKRDEAAKLREQLRGLDSSASLSSQEAAEAGILVRVLERLGGPGSAPTGPEDEKARRTADLLRILGDRKAAFLSDEVPGRYRYYSASHPDPSEQAPPSIVLLRQSGGTTDVETVPEPVDPAYVGETTRGLLPAETAERLDLVKVAKVRPQRGVRVLTSKTTAPRGEVIPSHHVQEVRLAPVSIRYDLPVRESEGWTNRTGILREVRSDALSRFLGAARDAGISASSVLKDVMATPWAEAAVAVPIAEAAARAAVALDLPRTGVPTLPAEVIARGQTARTDAPLGPLGTPDWVEAACASLADSMRFQVEANASAWERAVTGANGPDVSRKAIDTFWGSLAGRLRVSVTSQDRREVKETKRKEVQVQAPVFPVSDEGGYQVIGAYRYGRGVQPGAGGAWSDLRKQDPLSLLSRTTVDQVLDEVVTNRKPSAELSEKVARTLRENLQDDDLLELGLLRKKKDTDQLEVDLLNWVANGREGVHKLPAGNTPTELGDMALDPGRPLDTGCVCKVSPPGEVVDEDLLGDPGSVTEALVQRADQVAPQWRQRQDAVRGAGPGVRPAGSSSTVAQVDQAARQLEAAFSGFGDPDSSRRGPVG